MFVLEIIVCVLLPSCLPILFNGEKFPMSAQRRKGQQHGEGKLPYPLQGAEHSSYVSRSS